MLISKVRCNQMIPSLERRTVTLDLCDIHHQLMPALFSMGLGTISAIIILVTRVNAKTICSQKMQRERERTRLNCQAGGARDAQLG